MAPRALALLLWFAAAAFAGGPVYVAIWFDTEDYIEPAADDAALRLARDLDSLGVRATFKIVGEKARVLEQRGRKDVIRALALHDIGYHTDLHSVPPTPSVYLRDLGYLEGAAEFERRERRGFDDVRRVFGTAPSCYGQPGFSWGPQTNMALRRMGVPVYLDEGDQVGLGGQPFWFGGLLHVFHMEPYLLRASLDKGAKLEDDLAEFERAAAALESRGGGVISIYYHPTEFVATEFWDAVNFSHGANPERKDWKSPARRTPEDSERCYSVLRRFVEHAKGRRGVRFVTARDLPQLYQSPSAPPLDRTRIARHMAERQTWLATAEGSYSAADMLLTLLGMEPMYVDGPAARLESTFSANTVPRAAFERAKADAVSFISSHRRLPAAIWIGSEKLSIGDFAATLAAEDPAEASVSVRRANLEFEKQFSTDPAKSFDWVIHPQGFRAPELLELGRLQGWTLKPALLK